MTTTTDDVTIVVALECCNTRESCYFCGADGRREDIGFYTEYTNDRVCEECVAKRQPALHHAWEQYDREVLFLIDDKGFSDEEKTQLAVEPFIKAQERSGLSYVARANDTSLLEMVATSIYHARHPSDHGGSHGHLHICRPM